MRLDQRHRELSSFLAGLDPAEGLERLADEGVETLMAAAPGAAASGTDRDLARANEAVRKLQTGRPIDDGDAFLIEAIIIPGKRPAVLVEGDDFTVRHRDWLHFNDGDIGAALRAAIPAVGRIDLPENENLPYGGTGFVVGEGLVMTNRHVARVFAEGVGERGLDFLPGQVAELDFEREHGRGGENLFAVERIVMVHPWWDMALLSVPEIAGVINPLTLSTRDPEDFWGREIAAIGFPAFDPRNRVDVQNEVFEGIYNVKRMQPGRLKAREDVRSFGNVVEAVTHDASTLGGNSGSAVIEVRGGTVAALHFAGRYRVANYAVPAFELSRDGRVVDAGVNFDANGVNVDGPPPWQGAWNAVMRPEGPRPDMRPDEADAHGAATAGAGADGAATWTIPLQVTVRLGGAAGPALVAGQPVDAGIGPAEADLVEKAVEPAHDDDYAVRSGYDQDFLGMRVPMPRVRSGHEDLAAPLIDDPDSHVLDYNNFSIVMHKARRLALVTAANVDASRSARRPEAGRNYTRRSLNGFTSKNDREKWFPDPRIRPEFQLPDKFYNRDRKAFNKGHIVRRDAVAFGPSYRAVQFANGDTFHITNCSPQVADYNQSRLKGLWGQLENHVFDQAETEKLCVLAGPVLREDDPVFVGVDDHGTVRARIPRDFWKMVVARSGDDLQAFAFVLEQDLDDVDFGTEGVEEFAVNAKWRSHQVSVAELEGMLEVVEFDDILHGADQKTG